MATGNVIGAIKDRHRASEFIAFLKLLDREMPDELVLHIVADNLSSHKTKGVTEYLESRAGRFVIHHTPTHSSWLNLIERWFAELTKKQIRRGSWKSKRELEKAIYDFIHQWNQSGRPFNGQRAPTTSLFRSRKQRRIDAHQYHGILARLDLDGGPHRNPDGQYVPCPHIHLYREGYGDKWAWPVAEVIGGFTDDLHGAYDQFCSFCNITKPPHLQRGLF